MKPILEIQNVAKRFLIGHEHLPYYSFRDKLTSIFKSGTSKEEFWALKDVSFNVMPGDSLGIIGRNGAGKSTLLKILSRITPPTSGRIITRGRIASLLEVGTGFHQELSGRENIFMNGSILGMKREEIKNKFDEIVEFSGVEKFLDTQLKHYSSGMQLRLAFAVAAFLEPQILIIDEVLAVGDAEFQKKCLAKMEDVAGQGRTILFVSHNLLAIRSFCKKIVWLEQGSVKENGNDSILEKYLYESVNKIEIGGSRAVVLNDAISISECSVDKIIIHQFDDLGFQIRIESAGHVKINEVGLLIYNQYEERISAFDLRLKNMPTLTPEKNSIQILGTLDSLPMIPGDYFFRLYLNSSVFIGNTKSLVGFTILEKTENTGIVSYPVASRGVLDLKGTFNYA